MTALTMKWRYFSAFIRGWMKFAEWKFLLEAHLPLFTLPFHPINNQIINRFSFHLNQCCDVWRTLLVRMIWGILFIFLWRSAIQKRAPLSAMGDRKIKKPYEQVVFIDLKLCRTQHVQRLSSTVPTGFTFHVIVQGSHVSFFQNDI